MADINIIEKLQKLMITTPEEDKQYLNEIIDELQQSKKHEEDQKAVKIVKIKMLYKKKKIL